MIIKYNVFEYLGANGQGEAMFRVFLMVLVGLVGALALGLAWLSREQRSAVAAFGGIALLCAALAGAAFIVRGAWLDWALAIVAVVGVLAGFWGFLMAGAITRGINSMVVRGFEVGQPFALDGGSRIARVGGLVLRYEQTESPGEGHYVVTLKAILSGTELAPCEIVLRSLPDHPDPDAVIGDYRVQLIEVAERVDKSSRFKAMVAVTRP